ARSLSRTLAHCGSGEDGRGSRAPRAADLLSATRSDCVSRCIEKPTLRVTPMAIPASYDRDHRSRGLRSSNRKTQEANMHRSRNLALVVVLLAVSSVTALGMLGGASAAGDPVKFSKPTFVDPPKVLQGDSGDGRCPDPTHPCL